VPVQDKFVENKEIFKMQNTVNRNSCLDILKGICILMVVLTHYNWTGDETLKLLFPFWVAMAVPVFIIISGYVYTLSYERNGISEMSGCYGYRFVANKLIRYLIPYSAVCIIDLAVMILNKSVNPWGVLVSFFDGGQGPGSYYTPIMIQFIFVFPFVFQIIKKWDFNGVVICFFLNVFYEVLQRCLLITGTTYRLLLFRYLFLMGVGCYICIGKKQPKNIVKMLSIFSGGYSLHSTITLGIRLR
jgi:peptidoglycan/LPS O-acetylase OafA/YrhL